jgi:quaternary ammonium compound-resistance protein SugE
LPWLILVVAGLLEIVWAVGLPSTAGFTRPWPSLLVFGANLASVALLAVATRSIPLGTAYAVWVGIGVIGTAAIAALWFGEALTPARAGFLLLIVVGIVGLEVTTPDVTSAAPSDPT